ncbi:hypothetical protein ACJ41O_001767 [Fusarium nematophilum]
MVQADVNDHPSLLRAFKDTTAIFAVTTFWEFIPSLGRGGAGDAEVQQFINLAEAAASAPTLRHYVVSTLPPASRLSTETSNKPGSGHYAFVAPSSPSALFALGGDMETNCGVIVEGILNAGSNAFDKVAVCVTDYVPFRDVTVEFERVTGKAAAYLEISDKDIAKIWGPFGLEIASQLRWGEHYSDWDSFAGERAIGIEELGVSDRLVHFKEALEGLKDRLV